MNPYKQGLEKLNKIVKVTGDRVLLKAILQTDGSEIEVQGADTRTAVCHEVCDIGPDVKDIAIGAHCLHISAAGDGLDADQTQRGARYTIVREEDIVAWWYKDEAVAEYERLIQAADQA
jgi:hypothetical protein